jgi:hypothetical protein
MTGDRPTPAPNTSRQRLGADGKGPAMGWQAQEEAESADEALALVCRSARLTPAAYRFYRAILLAFVAHSCAPEPDEVEHLAEVFGASLESTLARLAAQDLLQRDPATGRIRAAYPFSGVSTPHRVTLFADQSGERTEEIAAQVYAMCALDALGIPLMLRRSARITAVDALIGEPIRVLVRPVQHPQHLPRAIPLAVWQAQWDPVDAVIYARPGEHEAEHDAGACIAAGTCCPITNFFRTPESAAAWAARQPARSLDGVVVGQTEALERAHALVAGVLDRLEA